jgi:hypothetical protein
MMIRRSSQTLQTLLLLPSPQPNTGFTEICSNQVLWLLQQQDTYMINFLLLLFKDMETQIRSLFFSDVRNDHKIKADHPFALQRFFIQAF